MLADALFGEEGAAGEATEEATEAAAGEATEEATEAAGDTTSDIPFEEPEEMTVGMHDAARMEGSREDGEVVVWAIDLDGGNFAVIFAVSATGEMADFEPTLMAIAETLTYTPMAGAEATDEATEEAAGEATEEATEESGG
jgi:hypothetical protein